MIVRELIRELQRYPAELEVDAHVAPLSDELGMLLAPVQRIDAYCCAGHTDCLVIFAASEALIQDAQA